MFGEGKGRNVEKKKPFVRTATGGRKTRVVEERLEFRTELSQTWGKKRGMGDRKGQREEERKKGAKKGIVKKNTYLLGGSGEASTPNKQK